MVRNADIEETSHAKKTRDHVPRVFRALFVKPPTMPEKKGAIKDV